MAIRLGTHGANQKSDPAEDAIAITKSDATVLIGLRGIYVGGTGDVAVTTPTGDVTFSAVPAGTILPVSASKVLSTGTTATLMVGLY